MIETNNLTEKEMDLCKGISYKKNKRIQKSGFADYEDLVQDAYVKALEAKQKFPFTEKTEFESWAKALRTSVGNALTRKCIKYNLQINASESTIMAAKKFRDMLNKGMLVSEIAQRCGHSYKYVAKTAKMTVTSLNDDMFRHFSEQKNITPYDVNLLNLKENEMGIIKDLMDGLSIQDIATKHNVGYGMMCKKIKELKGKIEEELLHA